MWSKLATIDKSGDVGWRKEPAVDELVGLFRWGAGIESIIPLELDDVREGRVAVGGEFLRTWDLSTFDCFKWSISFRINILTLPRKPTHRPSIKIVNQSASMRWFETRIEVPTGFGTSESPVR